MLRRRSISRFLYPDTPQGLLPGSRTRTPQRNAAVPWTPERLKHSRHCAFFEMKENKASESEGEREGEREKLSYFYLVNPTTVRHTAAHKCGANRKLFG